MSDLLDYSMTEATRLAAIDGRRYVVAVNGGTIRTMASTAALGGVVDGYKVVFETEPLATEATTKDGYFVVYLAGALRSGREANKAPVYHWGNGGVSALCGKEYGKRSAGWVQAYDKRVTCQKCLKLMEAHHGN